MAVRLYPLCSARRVTAPQAPLTTAAALPIHSSTGKVSIVVSLHDPSDCSLGLIRRLPCYRAAKLSTRFPQKTGVLRRSHLGNLTYPVTTLRLMPQRYLDQGLRLTYAFNHAEALRAFREAQRQDQNCAMCY